MSEENKTQEAASLSGDSQIAKRVIDYNTSDEGKTVPDRSPRTIRDSQALNLKGLANELQATRPEGLEKLSEEDVGASAPLASTVRDGEALNLQGHAKKIQITPDLHLGSSEDQPAVSGVASTLNIIETLKDKAPGAMNYFQKTMGLLATLSPDSTINPLSLAFEETSYPLPTEESASFPEPTPEEEAPDPYDTPLQRLLTGLPRIVLSQEGEKAEDSLEEVELLTELGKGGMGVVHLAHQHALGREIAVKQIRSNRISERTLKAMYQEATVTGVLEHPNIIPVYALGRDEYNRPLMLMKRVEGVTWRDMIRNEENPHWAQVKGDRLRWHLETFMQICNAVHFAHTRRIIHRDIKPDNVMIGDFGQVYLLDWGLGLRLDEVVESEGGSAELVGTPSYMAPEMIQGQVSMMDERTDVYLLGASLHEALIGHARHFGDSIHSVIFSVLESKPFRYPDSVPKGLADICNKATHVDPTKRFASAAALQEAIADFLQHRESLQLLEVAEEKLTALQTMLTKERKAKDEDATLIHKLFYECRFGFEQALRSWTENQVAKERLQDALEMMCRYQIQQREYRAAKALFDELQGDFSALRQELLVLKTEREAQEGAAEKLRAIERDSNLTISRKQRVLAAIAISVILSIGATIMITTGLMGKQLFDLKRMVVSLSAFSVVALVVLFLFRGFFFATKVNRQISLSVMLIVAMLLANRLSGYLLSRPFNHIMIGDLLMVSGLAIFGAITINPWFLVPGGVCLAGSFVAIFFVPYTLVCVGVVELICIVWFLFGVILPKGKRAAGVT